MSSKRLPGCGTVIPSLLENEITKKVTQIKGSGDEQVPDHDMQRLGRYYYPEELF